MTRKPSILKWTSPITFHLTFSLFVLLQLSTLKSFAQFTKLLDFDGTTKGAAPQGSLYQDGGFFYGTTADGGTNNRGTVFKIQPDGTGYVKLLDFNGTGNGSNPDGDLTYDGSFLYGMTRLGGTSNMGTVFKIKLDGTGFVKLLDFNGTGNGQQPQGSLIYDGVFLYGLTATGGANNGGTIFKIKTDGTGYALLLDFSSTTGINPSGTLFSDSFFLYGLTARGGTNNNGTIFKIKSDGTGFLKLLDFAGATNGRAPLGSLITDGLFLYGMTQQGGTSDAGTIFKIKPDGSSFSKLFDFNGTTNGNIPQGSLTLNGDGTGFYGMTLEGGSNDFGTIFKIKADGTGYVKLLDFDGINGQYPYGDLYNEVDQFLYGMTEFGGANNKGIIFRYDLLSTVPTITSFSPASGLIGTNITIIGTNFSTTPANNTVQFNGTTAVVTASTATSITTAVPAGATTGKIAVVVGSSTATSTNDFIVSTVSLPTITSFTPLSGPTGTTVTITGTNFSTTPANNTVTFNGATATVSASTTTSITTTVPASANIGKISVTVSGNTATSTNDFTVTTPLPTIISFNPTSGPINTIVTITGTNFSTTPANNMVKFNGTTTVVTASTATSITTTVPGGATTGKISVTVGGNTATSANDFTVTTSGGAVTINVESLSTSIGGTITKNLVPLITALNGSLDINSITVIVQPLSGAVASVSNGLLVVDYKNISFSGKESITIRACDTNGNCATQPFEIEVSGNVIVYNAVSPDGKNPILRLAYIDTLSPKNQVSIYNRWGDEVFSISDYDNSTRVFAGLSNAGNKLPSGTYFYKIVLPDTGKTMTGFLALKY
jgi:uncharacterized repeat protein (TIGR03803 family)